MATFSTCEQTRSAGNGRASNSPFFQAKLTINQPNDVYEQEADAMADKVMRMPDPASPKFFSPATSPIQRKHHGPDEQEEMLHRKETSSLQRKCQHCEDEAKKVHRKENSGSATQASDRLGQYIGNLGASGQPLSASSRQFFEPRFGHDFSNVRIHTDHVAAKSAQSINALAYTTGNNIVFNHGQYSPNSVAGKRLMAHELTHVVQQNNGVGRMIQKANIGHRAITWDDFQGTPTNSTFDAETFSDINYPDLTTIKPVITEKALNDDCEVKDGKTPATKLKKTEATIAIDSSGITVSSFMSQEKSWVKPSFKTEVAMKAFCSADTKTQKLITDCKTYFTQGVKGAATGCKPLLDACKNAVKKTTYTWGDIEAKDEAGCNDIFEACKKKQVNALKYKTGKGKDISSEPDCSPTLLDECLEIRKQAALDLLSHEQGHFDITDVLAQRLQTDVKAVVDAYTKKTVTGCGHDEAQKLANDVVEKEVKPKINEKIKEAQAKVDAMKGSFNQATKTTIPGKLKDTQNSYDTQTTHGTKPAEQQQWKENISKGAI